MDNTGFSSPAGRRARGSARWIPHSTTKTMASATTRPAITTMT